jgi:hypothetical protein
MNVFWPEGLNSLVKSGEISFKDGERLNLNVVRRMENGLHLISLKGKNFTAKLDFEPPSKTIRAEVVKTDGGLQLKFIPKAENSTNPMEIRQADTKQGEQRAIFKLNAGTIDVKNGEKLNLNILKTLENGKSLIEVKNNLFEIKLNNQILKSLQAEVIKTSPEIELAVTKLPVENLNANFVKQQVGGLDITKLMKAFGKFQSLDVSKISPENLKQAIKDSGLFLENRLLNGEDVSGDEKLRAMIASDTPAKEGITRMQVTNMLLAGGLLSFLKTKDENIDDTYMRMKKGKDGVSSLYISTKFSKLGDTFIIIRNLNKHNDIMVKTETDISEQIKNIEIENTRIHWYKFNKKDLDTMDVKKDIAFNMGNFEVII